MVIQTGAPAPAPASSGKKFLLFIIILLAAFVGLVYANKNQYITLPDYITKFIPPQYLPQAEAVAEAVTEQPAVSAYKDEPETYEEEMAKYEAESYKDETETYEEEKYVEEAAPEAYRPF